MQKIYQEYWRSQRRPKRQAQLLRAYHRPGAELRGKPQQMLHVHPQAVKGDSAAAPALQQNI